MSCKWHPIPTALFDISGTILLIKSESAWVAQTYGRLQNYTKLRRAFRRKSCANRPKEILANRNRQFFCAKQTNFAQTGHTRRRAEMCVAALQADSLSTSVSGRNVTGRICHLSFYTKQVSSPCHVSATHSRCSKNPPAVPRHTTPPGAVCGLFAQNLYILRKKIVCFNLAKFPLACLCKICGGMPSSTSYSSVADHTFAQPRPIHSS